MSKEIVFVAAKRTAFGALLGSFKAMTATELAIVAGKAALDESGLRADEIQHVIVGNVIQTSPDAIYLARHVGLKLGVPIEVPALTVNRLCGSGFQAIVSGAEQILLGEAQAVLVGGTENMTQAPHVLRGGREGWSFGKSPAVGDMLWDALTDSYVQTPMGITAENLGTKYGVTREMADEFALSSQTRWAAAQAEGRFQAEIVPVETKMKMVVATDEHPRPKTTIESLGKLRSVFKKDGLVTAGNASGISDGAAMLVMTSAEFAKDRGLKPIARLVAWSVVGVDPALMGIGPAPAIRACLKRASLRLEDMALVEINEAFAAQYLACEKELELDRAKTNVDGGAIALGHPLAASGARLTTHLLHEARRRGVQYAIGSACIGGGQGMAVLTETIM
jgi:acetyl-CoA acetyltransferase family protein